MNREQMASAARSQARERGEREGKRMVVWCKHTQRDKPERDTWYVRSPEEGQPEGAVFNWAYDPEERADA